MTRPLLAGVLLLAVLAGSVVVGAVNTITREHWPDW